MLKNQKLSDTKIYVWAEHLIPYVKHSAAYIFRKVPDRVVRLVSLCRMGECGPSGSVRSHSCEWVNYGPTLCKGLMGHVYCSSEWPRSLRNSKRYWKDLKYHVRRQNFSHISSFYGCHDFQLSNICMQYIENPVILHWIDIHGHSKYADMWYALRKVSSFSLS